MENYIENIRKELVKYRLWLKRNVRPVYVVVALVVIFSFLGIVTIFNNRVETAIRQIERKDALLEQRTEKAQELRKQLDSKDTKLEDQKRSNEALRDENEQLESDLQAKKTREAEEARQAALAAQKEEGLQETVSPQTTYAVGCGNYQGLLAQYDWNVSTMARIMKAESGCDPGNHNWGDNHGSCKGSFGLLQVGCVHGYSADHLSSPANNVAAAYKIWRSSGYGAWTTY